MDYQKISFLEKYVLSEDRLKTTASSFSEDAEEYWYYSLLCVMNKAQGDKDPQTAAWPKKVDKPAFKESANIQHLRFRQMLKSMNQSDRAQMVSKIKSIVGLRNSDLSGGRRREEKKQRDESSSSPNAVVYGEGTRAAKRGGIEVDINAAVRMFMKRYSDLCTLDLTKVFSPSAVDVIVTKDTVDKLTPGELDGIFDLLKKGPPSCKQIEALILRDLKVNPRITFGDRDIHHKLTVVQVLFFYI